MLIIHREPVNRLAPKTEGLAFLRLASFAGNPERLVFHRLEQEGLDSVTKM